MQYAEELQRLWDEGFKAAVANRRAGKKNTAPEGGVKYASGNVTTNAKDVLLLGDGVTKAVNINTARSGLRGIPKGLWAKTISDRIKNSLAGKAIIAADGDIIRITARGAGEVAFGSDMIDLKSEARKTGNFAEVDRKLFSAEHAASIISLSTYDGWSANMKDPSDMFKRDGIGRRKVIMRIDGVYYEATMLTGLNDDPSQGEDYGEKFYDLTDIKEISAEVRK